MKKLLFLMLTFSLLLVGCGNKTDKAAPAVEEQVEEQVGKVDTTISNSIAETFLDAEEEIKAEQGFVCYEGRSNYYIVETFSGFTVLHTLTGFLREGDYVFGQLNFTGMGTVERLPSHFTVEVDVLQSLLSERLAVEWMGDHKYLKPSDQKIYDGEE